MGYTASMQRRTAPLLYLWIWGAMLIGLGAGGLILNPDFSVGEGVEAEHLFGVFETNGWHAVAGLGFGLLSVIVAAAFRQWATPTALAVAVLGGLLPTVSFLIAGDNGVALGLIPVDITDAITLHLLPGLIGIGCVALSSPRSEDHPNEVPAPPHVRSTI
jgi:hypothetical protein